MSRAANPRDILLRPVISEKSLRLADDGKYTVKVEKSFPLTKTGEALSYGRTGDREGKVIIDVRKDANKT